MLRLFLSSAHEIILLPTALFNWMINFYYLWDNFNNEVFPFVWWISWYKSDQIFASTSCMTSFASEKKLMQICISNSSQCSTPLGGMRCSLNIPGHPIITSKNVIMLPSNGMEKPQLPMITFLLIFKTFFFFFFLNWHMNKVIIIIIYTTLLCSLIFQKQESREMSHTNLTGLIQKKLKGRYAKLIFSVETIHVLKKTTVNR